MDMEFINIRPSWGMKAFTLIIKSKVKESYSIMITQSLTKVYSRTECLMERELQPLKMELSSRLNGSME